MTVLDPPGTATIALAGDYDTANAASITDQVSAALTAGAGSVSIDAAQVTFMDSTALSALVQSLRLCGAAGVPLALARPSHRVVRILQLGGLADAFGIADPAQGQRPT